MAQQKRIEDYEDSYQENQKEIEVKQQLAESFNLADVYLNRRYLDYFWDAPIRTLSLRESSVPPQENIRLIEINKLVYDKEEKMIDKLKSVYSALHRLNSSVALILNSEKNTVHFYVGICCPGNAPTAAEILDSTLKGNFPGIGSSSLTKEAGGMILDSFEEHGAKSLAAVSLVPSMREEEYENETFVQGIEKFIDTMNGKSYTAVFLAEPVDDAALEQRKHGFEELCSALSPHEKISVALGKNVSTAVSNSVTKSFSTSVSRSVSNSNTESSSRSSGTNSGNSGGSSMNFGWNGHTDSGGWNAGFGSNSGWSNGSFNSYTSGSSFTRSVSETDGSSEGESIQKGTTDTIGTSKTLTLTYENKSVVLLKQRAQEELDRFRMSESFGMWEFCGYFLSKDINTTVLAAATYRALMSGDKSNVESAHMNIWSLSQKDTIHEMLEYIKRLKHPQAVMPVLAESNEEIVTPTNLVTGYELPLVMGFPKKSVAGLAVIEMAEFGRTVVYENKEPKRSMDFGSIYHMGVVEDSRVRMDLDLLASHCFITGSSGSGKSYATYQLLHNVIENDVNILVIEPAKGEYKQVFGGLKGIKIYTTDPNAYRLLKINPFQFPENMHILSHIEQLLQIFNASWPLYAAMPAILKQAVNEAYIKCGWDIDNSIWIPGISDHKYPVFADVMEVLPEIINTSDYSADSKGDYKGALLTRVQSMTVGINGLIFRNSIGLDDSLLFDTNVVIDLSELGSDEAIALIMGVLIMKLNEYRKSQRKADPHMALNSNLQHVTVLEEAHNLLKRTSKDQNQEGANMIGKSVEMISNSIKEMRTYGEGFIIIDQSPMAVDSSAIENTATKIIMNTPAKDACIELGSALSLNEKQTGELSRLNVGVAAVFQKGWLTPVLMKVDLWDNRYNAAVEYTDTSILKVFKGQLVSALLKQWEARKISPMSIRSLIRSSELTDDKKREFQDLIAAYNEHFPADSGVSVKNFSNLMLDICGCSQMFHVLPADGVPTYAEYMKFSDDELPSVNKQYLDGVNEWLTKAASTLDFYLILDDENLKNELLVLLLYAAGKGGSLKNNQNSRVVMICRYICREMGIGLED